MSLTWLYSHCPERKIETLQIDYYYTFIWHSFFLLVCILLVFVKRFCSLSLYFFPFGIHKMSKRLQEMTDRNKTVLMSSIWRPCFNVLKDINTGSTGYKSIVQFRRVTIRCDIFLGWFQKEGKYCSCWVPLTSQQRLAHCDAVILWQLTDSTLRNHWTESSTPREMKKANLCLIDNSWTNDIAFRSFV